MDVPAKNGHAMDNEPHLSHRLELINKAKIISDAFMQRLAGQNAGAGAIVLACLCMAIAYKSRRGCSWRAPRPRAVFHRSVSLAALHGGNVTLKRILDSVEARVDEPTMHDVVIDFKDLLSQEPLKFSKLQRCAAKLEMSGKEDEAVEALRKAWEKAVRDHRPQEAHELQMLLVEMLIYKGEYKTALGCKCLEDREISDARGPLYQAVIYAITEQKKLAKERYVEFQSIRNRFLQSIESFEEDSPLYGMVHSFENFEKMVEKLRKENEHARRAKTV